MFDLYPLIEEVENRRESLDDVSAKTSASRRVAFASKELEATPNPLELRFVRPVTPLVILQ